MRIDLANYIDEARKSGMSNKEIYNGLLLTGYGEGNPSDFSVSTQSQPQSQLPKSHHDITPMQKKIAIACLVALVVLFGAFNYAKHLAQANYDKVTSAALEAQKQTEAIKQKKAHQASAVSLQVPADWKTYTNHKYGYQFSYPPNLYLDAHNENIDCTGENSCGVELRISKIDQFVRGVQPPGTEGVDWTANGYFISFSVFKNYYQGTFDFGVWASSIGIGEIVSKKEINIWGTTGYEYSQTGCVGCGYPQVVVPRNKSTYLVNFSANDDRSEKEGLVVFNQILSTFKFIDKTAEGQFCGGIAAGAFPCPEGYTCELDGSYPDAGGQCVKSE